MALLLAVVAVKFADGAPLPPDNAKCFGNQSPVVRAPCVPAAKWFGGKKFPCFVDVAQRHHWLPSYTRILPILSERSGGVVRAELVCQLLGQVASSFIVKIPVRRGSQSGISAPANADGAHAKIHEIPRRIRQIAPVEEPVDVIYGLEPEGPSLLLLVDEKLLFRPAAQPCLKETGENTVVGAGCPSCNCGGSDHPLEKAVEHIMDFDDIAVAPRLGRRHEQAETGMRSANARRSLNELGNVVRHSGKKHGVELINVHAVGNC